MEPIILDCHIHHYPEAIIANPAAWATAWNEPHWKSLVTSQGPKKSLQGWATEEQLLADMAAANISQVLTLGWYWQNHATCVWHNEYIAKFAHKHPSKIIPFAAIQPLAGNSATEHLKWLHDNGFKGLGEVFPAVQGFKLNNPTWVKIVEWAIEHNWPINMHVTEPASHDYSGKVHSPLHEIQAFAQRYPELKLILAHWGGLLPFYELNPTTKKALSNVYYDTSASPLLYDKKIFRSVLDAIGPDKILYGSDYPLRLYPKTQQIPNFTNFLIEINTAGLSAAELSKILGKNLIQLLPS